jgi:hypothetical protein
MARAIADDKVGVALRIRLPTTVTTPVTYAVTAKVARQVKKVVDGRTVVDTKYHDVNKMETRLLSRFGGWREINVGVDGFEVVVLDLNGKLVRGDRLLHLLAKEGPLLLSTSGRVDPFYLQTTKPGTLIAIVPPDLVYPPVVTEPAPQPKNLLQAPIP